MIPTGEMTGIRHYYTSIQWSLLTAVCTLPNEIDAIETDEQNSVKGNQKGRPCGGLPSKPSCVKVHRMTHPFSSYYKQST